MITGFGDFDQFLAKIVGDPLDNQCFDLFMEENGRIVGQKRQFSCRVFRRKDF
jgi:hypothetical protein